MSIHPPEPPSTAAKVGAAVTRAGLSAVPVAGGALVEVFEAVASAGYARRRAAWMADVSDAINRLVLEPQRLDWESLSQNEGFLDAIGQATRAAVQTRDTTKLEALRNAVVNAAARTDLDADRTAILLDLVATLTGTHLRVLSVFADPKAAYTRAGKPLPDSTFGDSRQTVVNDLLSDLAADKALLDKVVADLDTHQLAHIDLHTMMTVSGVLASASKPLGDQLVDLVTLPPTNPADQN